MRINREMAEMGGSALTYTTHTYVQWKLYRAVVKIAIFYYTNPMHYPSLYLLSCRDNACMGWTSKLSMYYCLCMCIISNIYSTVGRSIADIYDQKRGVKRQGKYAAEVVYRGYRLTYRIIYTILYVIYAMVREYLPKTLPKTTPLLPKVYFHRYRTTSQCLSFYGSTITIV